MYRSIPCSITMTLLCLTAGAAAAQDSLGDLAQYERLQARLADVADEVRPSVVAIRADRRLDLPDSGSDIPTDVPRRNTRDRLYPAVGTGTIITADGLILTNEHVVHNASPENIECILFDGQTYRVAGLTTDPRSDLAVLRIEARGLKPARLGDLAGVRQGHFAIAMGNPLGSASENSGRASMSFGVISAIGQDLTQKLDVLQQRYYGNLLQTDARINPGNSGGPLLNFRGEVIGVTTALSTRSGGSEGVGYAIPLDRRTKDIINTLARGEEVEYGLLGVRLEAPTDADRQASGGPVRGGAVVRQVEPNTPAAEVGLRAGDLGVEFDNDIINDVDQLIRLVGAATVGRDVVLILFRNDQRISVSVKPARKDVLRGVNIEKPLDWRGMRVVNPTSEVLQALKLPDTVDGVVVTHVEPSSAADKAGLRPGDVIQQVGDERMRSVRRLRDLSARLSGPVKIGLAGNANPQRTLP